MTAAELSDPNIDHLAVMALLSKFVHITPPTPNPHCIVLLLALQGHAWASPWVYWSWGYC